MGTVPPRPLHPVSHGVTFQQAADALLQLTPPYYTIWCDDGLSASRYGDMTYPTPDDAQAVCEALQDVYGRLAWDCCFSVRLRNAPIAIPSPIP